jgi:O-antigen/teichoic acid export membrane protein
MKETKMKFAKLVFLIAGIYGLIVLVPQYFFEARTGHDYPPPITHPEYYYGFIGLAVVWQLVFLILSRDPVRYRPLMIPAILEKACFAIPAVILLSQHRIPGLTFGFAMVDVVLGVLFLIAYVKTKDLQLKN